MSQIVVGLPDVPSLEAIKKAEKKAVQIRDALLKGAPFAQMAVRYSDAPEASQGGVSVGEVLELNPYLQNHCRGEEEHIDWTDSVPRGFHLIAVRDRRGISLWS